jgi:hypothetical protein
VGFTLRQFSAVFKLRDASGQPYVLIGGQAVNYWAERYRTVAPQLEQFQPFTSEDIDLKGTREDVGRIARQLHLTALYPHRVEMTALAGIIPFQIGNLESSIEVVRRLPGVSDTVAVPAVEAEFGGQSIRVLDPISLLACKLELSAEVSQQDRRDVEHLRILLRCVPAFLAEILGQVELNELPARDWLNVVKRVLKLTRSSRALKLGHTHRIDWAKILPVGAIARCSNPAIRRFYERQCAPSQNDPKG